MITADGNTGCSRCLRALSKGQPLFEGRTGTDDDGKLYCHGCYDQLQDGGSSGWTVIHSYNRAQAIADGSLVDVSPTATEAGFLVPVALTRSAWERCVSVPNGVTGQDEIGRLWDVLSVLRFSIEPQGRDADRLVFTVSVRNTTHKAEDVRLWAHCGPGDQGEPVITVLLIGED